MRLATQHSSLEFAQRLNRVATTFGVCKAVPTCPQLRRAELSCCTVQKAAEQLADFLTKAVSPMHKAVEGVSQLSLVIAKHF